MTTRQSVSIGSSMHAGARGAEASGGRQFWFVTMTACFAGGLVLGLAAIVFATIAAAGLMETSRSLSLTVASMIVASLGLMLFGAHALDRMDEAERRSREAAIEGRKIS